MKKLYFFLITVLAFSPVLTFAMANPASVYCVDHGGTNVINQANAPDLCKFKDGTECGESAYYNGTCTKGEYSNWATGQKVAVKNNTSNTTVEKHIILEPNNQITYTDQNTNRPKNNNLPVIILSILVVILATALYFKSKKR